MVLFTSCYYDVEEDLYEIPECAVENMSYQNDILPIIQNNCYICHDAKNNFGNVTLEGYDGLKNYATNGKLIGVINHASGFPSMPQNANKLLECEIEKIESWVTDGAPNN
jgi:hypothetical protein